MQLSTTLVQIACGICALLVIARIQNCSNDIKMDHETLFEEEDQEQKMISNRRTIMDNLENLFTKSLAVDTGIIIIYIISGMNGFIGMYSPSRIKIVVRCTVANLLSSVNMFLMVEFA